MDVLARIYELRIERGWTEYQLAEASGLPQSTISSWYRKGMLPSIGSLEKICVGFGISISYFFANNQEALVLTEEQNKVLRCWQKLNGAQREALLAFLEQL